MRRENGIRVGAYGRMDDVTFGLSFIFRSKKIATQKASKLVINEGE